MLPAGPCGGGGRRPPDSPHGEPAQGQRDWFVNREGMTMLAVAAGTFTQGDLESDAARPHPVTLTRPFFLCDREVTLDQFRQFVAEADYDVEKPAGWSPPAEGVAPTGNARWWQWAGKTPCCSATGSAGARGGGRATGGLVR